MESDHAFRHPNAGKPVVRLEGPFQGLCESSVTPRALRLAQGCLTMTTGSGLVRQTATDDMFTGDRSVCDCWQVTSCTSSESVLGGDAALLPLSPATDAEIAQGADFAQRPSDVEKSLY